MFHKIAEIWILSVVKAKFVKGPETMWGEKFIGRKVFITFTLKTFIWS